MKQGLLEISPETKDISLEYSKILNSFASEKNKNQKTMPSSQIKFEGGVWLKYFQTILPKKVCGSYL